LNLVASLFPLHGRCLDGVIGNSRLEYTHFSVPHRAAAERPRQLLLNLRANGELPTSQDLSHDA
jgi:hypothetical protein